MSKNTLGLKGIKSSNKKMKAMEKEYDDAGVDVRYRLVVTDDKDGKIQNVGKTKELQAELHAGSYTANIFIGSRYKRSYVHSYRTLFEASSEAVYRNPWSPSGDQLVGSVFNDLAEDKFMLLCYEVDKNKKPYPSRASGQKTLYRQISDGEEEWAEIREEVDELSDIEKAILKKSIYYQPMPPKPKQPLVKKEKTPTSGSKESYKTSLMPTPTGASYKQGREIVKYNDWAKMVNDLQDRYASNLDALGLEMDGERKMILEKRLKSLDEELDELYDNEPVISSKSNGLSDVSILNYLSNNGGYNGVALIAMRDGSDIHSSQHRAMIDLLHSMEDKGWISMQLMSDGLSGLVYLKSAGSKCLQGGKPSNANEYVGDPEFGNIRNLLVNGFSIQELRAFCQGNNGFRAVTEEYTDKTPRGAMVDLIINHADRRGTLSFVVEWAKANNPGRYAMYAPYFS